MAAGDGFSMKKSERKSKHETANKRRKREHQTAETYNPSINGVLNEKNGDSKTHKHPFRPQSIAVDSLNTPPPSSAQSVDKRQNPFFMSAPKISLLDTTLIPSRSEVNAVTPPPRSPPSSTPTKKTVQFKDSEDSDDSDFTPKTKRKTRPKLLSPKHGPSPVSPKVAPLSPKKISTKSKLLDRKRELELERKKLPIWTAREPLLKLIDENQVTILLGETGCGKSTQLPQFLLPKYGNQGIIGITQPRRVAAINLARRVAEEHGTQLRNKVGYSIRFDDATTSETRIKYVTDGMLLRELQSSPNLAAYSVIILDEAHERSLRTDLLLGLIKFILPQRPELRLVVMSATLDAERFREFFEIDGKKAEIGYVEGRSYPVEVVNTSDLATTFDGAGSGDYIEGALRCILQIHMTKEEGDILVFLTGQNDIESLELSLNSLKSEIPKNRDNLLICPLYAALPQNVQHRAFVTTPPGSRKIILATNIAETSVTVPGVRFVIDCGLQKRRKFNAHLGIETLQIHEISKSSAAQRAGRAGREAPGLCYRLYPESQYLRLRDNTTPEIRECDLTSLVLTLKIQGYDDVLNFPFLDRPKRDSVIRSLELLYLLGALDKHGKHTELGKQMNHLPLPPELAKVLLSAAMGEVNCVSEVIDIISCMSASSASSNAIFHTPNAEKREEAMENRKHFASSYGDHITLLRAFREYLSIMNVGSQGDGVKEWCRKWGINRRLMKTVVEIRKQLISFCQRNNISVNAVERPDPDAILKAFLSGYMLNTAFLQLDGSYRTGFSHHTVAIHPSSVLFGIDSKKPTAIMYHELIATTKNYARGVSAIEQDWLQQVAPGLAGLSVGIRS